MNGGAQSFIAGQTQGNTSSGRILGKTVMGGTTHLTETAARTTTRQGRSTECHHTTNDKQTKSWKKNSKSERSTCENGTNEKHIQVTTKPTEPKQEGNVHWHQRTQLEGHAKTKGLKDPTNCNINWKKETHKKEMRRTRTNEKRVAHKEEREREKKIAPIETTWHSRTPSTCRHAFDVGWTQPHCGVSEKTGNKEMKNE